MVDSRLRETLNTQAPLYYRGEQNNNRDQLNSAVTEIGLDTHGFDALGSGAGRNVFDMGILGYDNLALKLAQPDPQYNGLKQNRREIETWTHATATQKQYLARIVDHGPNHYWLIMPKGTSVTTIPYEWKTDAEYELRDLVWREDIREENLINVNGKLKLCDYGTPPQ